MSPLSGYVDAAIAHAKVVLSAGHFHNLAKLTHARSLVARLLADAEDYKPALSGDMETTGPAAHHLSPDKY